MRNGSGLTVGFFLVVIALFSYFQPYDSTDDEENKERSGMRLYTDHQTGCQYLSGSNFLGPTGITPRLDGNGNHIC